MNKVINQEIIDKFFKETICSCGNHFEYYRNSKVAKYCPKCYSNSWIEYEPHDITLKYPKFKESDFYVTREAEKPFPSCKGFPRSRLGFVWLTKYQSNRITWDTSRSEMLSYPHIVFVPTEPKPECETDPITIFMISIAVCVLVYEFIIKPYF